MKALELLRNKEHLLVADSTTSKHMRTLSSSLNQLISDMDDQIMSFKEYAESQLDGELNGKIIVAKSLAEFFKNNKFLRLESIIAGLKADENNRLSMLYSIKNKLMDTIKTIIKDSHKEAAVSAFDLFEGDFRKCDEGHEIVVLNGKNSQVLEEFLKVINEQVVMKGNFDSIEAQDVDFNTEVLDRNIALCSRKNDELYGDKNSKHSKVDALIKHLESIGRQVVAFYTYKDTLVDVGVSPKGIKDFKHELSKLYIPIKKALQKEFRIELEDICNVVVNEEEYMTASVDNISESTDNNSPIPYITEYNPDDYVTTNNQAEIAQLEQEPGLYNNNYSEEVLETTSVKESQQDIINSVTADLFGNNEESSTYIENNNKENQTITSDAYEQNYTSAQTLDAPFTPEETLTPFAQSNVITEIPTNNYSQYDSQETPDYAENTQFNEQPLFSQGYPGETLDNFDNNQTTEYYQPTEEPDVMTDTDKYNNYDNNYTQPTNNMFQDNEPLANNMFSDNYNQSQNMFEDNLTVPNDNFNTDTSTNNMFENNANQYGNFSDQNNNTNEYRPVNSNPFGSSTGNMFED